MGTNKTKLIRWIIKIWNNFGILKEDLIMKLISLIIAITVLIIIPLILFYIEYRLAKQQSKLAIVLPTIVLCFAIIMPISVLISIIMFAIYYTVNYMRKQKLDKMSEIDKMNIQDLEWLLFLGTVLFEKNRPKNEEKNHHQTSEKKCPQTPLVNLRLQDIVGGINELVKIIVFHERRRKICLMKNYYSEINRMRKLNELYYLFIRLNTCKV